MVPGNIESVADYISSQADIYDTFIHFRPGTFGILLTIPIPSPESAIVITLGINNSYPNTHESKPMFRVTEFFRSNSFYIVDAGEYDTSPPCYPVAEEMDETLVSAGTKVPSTFKLTIIPQERFGYCETAQDGGYMNVGVFPEELNLNMALVFELVRDNSEDQYFIHYISIHSI